MTIDELKRLTDAKLNERAARAAGWRHDEDGLGAYWTNPKGRSAGSVCDFCADLNAVQELVAGLSIVERDRLIEALATLKDWRTRLELMRCDEEMLYDFTTASARDRVIAYIAAKEIGHGA